MRKFVGLSEIPALSQVIKLREDSLDKSYVTGDLNRADAHSRAPFDPELEKIVTDYVIRMDRIGKMQNDADKHRYFTEALRQFAHELVAAS